MITYAYWGCIIALVILLLFVIGGKLDNWKAALFAAVLVLIAGWATYYFHFQQIFVKRYGGVMTVSVPSGQQHITATWKDENLWIENYDPVKNTCHFEEYSKGNVLQGKVTIKNCNPIALRGKASARCRRQPQQPRRPMPPHNKNSPHKHSIGAVQLAANSRTNQPNGWLGRGS